jgi:hypothetical protein
MHDRGERVERRVLGKDGVAVSLQRLAHRRPGAGTHTDDDPLRQRAGRRGRGLEARIEARASFRDRAIGSAGRSGAGAAGQREGQRSAPACG